MKLQSRHEQDFETYLKSIRLRPITYRKHLLYFKHFIDMFGGFITQKAIDSFLTQKTTPNHRATINHLIDLLKRDGELTQEEQVEVSRFVILKVAGMKEKKLISTLTKTEIQRIIDNCNLSNEFTTEKFRLMVQWQYSSGLRIHELCNLRWEHLCYQGRTKFYEDGRDKLKYQKLEITPDIAKMERGGNFFVRTDIYLAYFSFLKKWANIEPKIVEKIKRNDCPIWRRNKKKYSEDFKKQVVHTLGFRLAHNQNTHILRHSIATHLLMDGMPLLEVKGFMRHSSVKETERYLHLAEDLVSKGLEKIGNSSGN